MSPNGVSQWGPDRESGTSKGVELFILGWSPRGLRLVPPRLENFTAPTAIAKRINLDKI